MYFFIAKIQALFSNYVLTCIIFIKFSERDDVDFLEDLQMDSDFDSIWQLERGAKEGLTSGIDESPTEDHHHHQASGGPIKLTSGNGGCCPVIVSEFF